MDVQPKGITRRRFLAGSAALAAGALLAEKGWVAAQPFFGPDGVDVEGLERNGFLVRHTICHQCGAGCGLTALVRKDAPPSQENMLIFGNQHPDHPQRGMCGRGATAPYTWDSPLRLRKPLKRVGERGEGRFEEVSWDQALDEIAAKVREIVERDGARSLAFSTHDYASEQRLAAYALGSPNVISQASTCNTAGVVARRWMMGSGFDHHATIDPDYDNVRYVLFPGRSLNAPIGAVHRLAKARERGAKAVFLNPAHPDVAFADSEWIPCVPGTDAAFMLGVAHILVNENRYDRSFVLDHTNLPFLLKADGKPLTQQDLVADGDANVFALMGVEGEIVFHDAAGIQPDLTYAGTATLADGAEVPVTTAWNRLVEHLADYTAGNAAQITGVPSATIERVARDLFVMQGVVEDTWYNTRNGNDTDAVLALMTVNALLGNIDKVGGMGVRLGTKLPGIESRASDGTVKIITGDSYVMEQTKRIDQELYPETNATFDAVFTGILEERPYPITGLVLTGATIFQRDPNVARSIEAIKKLDLLVTIDIVHQEICDWSDYVLPAEMFLERDHIANIGWTQGVSVALQQKVTDPPAGVDARPDAWILLEMVRRAYPERAYMIGYLDAYKDVSTFKHEFWHRIEELRIEGLANAWDRDKDELRAQLIEDGFVTLQAKQYGLTPYSRPFASPSGRLEVYAFRPVLRGYREHGFATHFDPPAYTMPQASDEFFLVNGKSPIGGSGVSGLAFPTQYLVDNRLWMNPADAERMSIATNDEVEVEGLDTGWIAKVKVNVTPRVIEGTTFVYSYSGGNRQKVVANDPRFAKLASGLAPHWFSKSWVDPVTGSNFNNASVRIRRA